MPYHHLEEIQSRRGEKIAMFLTMENAMGLILGALPTYILTTSLPFVIRVPLIVLTAILGIALTLDVGGMAGYERLLWRARGAIRIRTQQPLITPEQLTGAVPNMRHNRPLPIGGPIRHRLPTRTPTIRPARLPETKSS